MVLDNYLADGRAIDKESDEQIQEDITLLTIGYVLIIAYTNVVLYKNSCLSCKMHLSLAAVVGVGMALMAAFGMAQTFGIKVTISRSGDVRLKLCFSSSTWSFKCCRS